MGTTVAHANGARVAGGMQHAGETTHLLALSIAMFAGAFVAGYVPLLMSNSNGAANTNKMRLITLFGAGILAGTALIVIIPEGISMWFMAMAMAASEHGHEEEEEQHEHHHEDHAEHHARHHHEHQWQYCLLHVITIPNIHGIISFARHHHPEHRWYTVFCMSSSSGTSMAYCLWHVITITNVNGSTGLYISSILVGNVHRSVRLLMTNAACAPFKKLLCVFDKLLGYTSLHSVPRGWRFYNHIRSILADFYFLKEGHFLTYSYPQPTTGLEQHSQQGLLLCLSWIKSLLEVRGTRMAVVVKLKSCLRKVMVRRSVGMTILGDCSVVRVLMCCLQLGMQACTRKQVCQTN